MIELLVLEQAAARQRAKRAEHSLDQAKTMLDKNYGLAISLAICSRIRTEERRARTARSRMVKIIPTY